ncbi:MAG: hypothetical protein HQM00_01825 [Magnetococcales bacterium]|nr:hypothetical protein [Magnetococcales bacterium]
MQFALGGDASYILKADLGKPDPTVFTIKTLNMAERVRIASMAAGMAADITQENAPQQIGIMLDLCKLGVRGIVGGGIPASMSVDGILDLATDPQEIAELVNAIVSHNRVGREMEKNSNGQSAPQIPVGCAIAARTSQGRTGAARKRRSSGSPGSSRPKSVR